MPIPWTADGPSFGFGDNGSWLPQPGDFGKLSVESQTGVDGSTLELYRAALAARAARLVADDELEWVEVGPGVLAFRRGSGVLCVVNFGPTSVPIPDGDVLVASDDLAEGLPTDAAVWLAPN